MRRHFGVGGKAGGDARLEALIDSLEEEAEVYREGPTRLFPI